MDKHPEIEQTNHDRPRLTVLTEAELESVSGGRGSAQGIAGFRNAGGNSTAHGGDPSARNIGLDPGAVTRFLPRS
jgi:hypothetical protein